jgi:hypothetical protein
MVFLEHGPDVMNELQDVIKTWSKQDRVVKWDKYTLSEINITIQIKPQRFVSASRIDGRFLGPTPSIFQILRFTSNFFISKFVSKRWPMWDCKSYNKCTTYDSSIKKNLPYLHTLSLSLSLSLSLYRKKKVRIYLYIYIYIYIVPVPVTGTDTNEIWKISKWIWENEKSRGSAKWLKW